MVDISLMIEGQNGLTWPRWQALSEEVERLGFAGLFRSDHFTNPQPPEQASLEMLVSLTYLATQTRRIHFGPLVAPVSFRDPIFLARQAAAIDDLSQGRMILGLGAGWNEREHTMFGYKLGDIEARMQRLQEALEVTRLLLKSEEPVNFTGTYFQLREAVLLPHPQRPGGPRILIGGNGPKRTLPLVARYADIWNGVFISAQTFRERSDRLDALLQAAGRQPAEVRRTVMLTGAFGKNPQEVERRLGWQRTRSELAHLSTEQVIIQAPLAGIALAGNSEQILSQIQTYQEAGAQEIMLQWLDLDDLDGIRDLAEQVLPHIK